MIRSLALIGSILLLWPLVALCYHHWPPVQPAGSAEAKDYVMPGAVWPEPGERHAYLAALLVLPPLLFGQLLLFRALGSRSGAGYRPWLVQVAGTLVLALLGWVVWRTLRPEGWQQLQHNLFVRRPLLTLPLFLAAIVAAWRDGGQNKYLWRAAGILVMLAIVPIGLLFVFNGNHGYTFLQNFDAVFFSVVQVHQGKNLLVDAACQYGLYGEILAPLFNLIGLSVVGFTAVMAGLLIGSYFLLWGALRRTVRRPSVAAAGLLALLFNAVAVFVTDLGGVDTYFQYLPVRLVFPAALVGLGAAYLNRPRRGLYLLTLVVLSVGVLWNLDSGVPALLTWLIVLSYGELPAPPGRAAVRILGHCAACVAVAAGTIGLYGLATWLAAGAWPNVGEALAFQRAFYLSGFAMLPAPWPGLWMLVLLVYAAGLAHAALALLNGPTGPRDRMVLLLSVLGFGLFSYYQGRSHIQCLRLACWPAFLLMAVFLDGLVDRLRAGPLRVLDAGLALTLAWFLGGSAVSLVSIGNLEPKPLILQFSAHLRQVLHREPEWATGVERWIHGQAGPGESLVFLGRGEAYWHLRTNLPAPQQRATIEMLLLRDFEALADGLEAGAPVLVVVERGYLEQLSGNKGYDLLRQRLRDTHYRVQDVHGPLAAIRYTPHPENSSLPTVGAVLDAPPADAKTEAAEKAAGTAVANR